VTGSILISPVVAAGVVKGVSGLNSVAAIFSEITIGSDEGAKDDRRQPMVSHGFGWSDGMSDAPVLSGDKDLVPYPEITDVHSGNVIMQTFGEYTGREYFDLEKCGQVRNCTEESSNVLLAQSRLKPEFSIKLNSTPQVLIMHTHTTESFEPYERDYYDASFSYRTSDESMNVVAVGEEMRVQIESYGISVIHDTTIHDYPSYNGSYERSAETVRKILEENPDIKVVLDIHRDAIASENDLIAPVTKINGKNAAQIMIVSGCDDGTMDMPDYLQNFRLASMFQQQIEGDYPGLTRPVLFDYRNYNQGLTTGSLLIEVGSHGNSIDQVRYAGELIGKSIGKALQKLV
jgi:stage II sporulation protein P